ncbi:transcription factor ABORTED MICROSPORES [Pyrus ussuriensis x Pyrus communis]|uniref:Transcription factor ABORTED MICROSPORES n=1 Tax=Pyrus ussuriensis x Pyrus communis TaxID=2448454 RepID=A0A5N5FBQ4_9ROSA|nr:transcription factor ABORTED MICROSPORES [Pyrus ussuriensis x Pyrus communis]
MMIMPNLIQRLRSLVGLKGWDCCVFWKLSEDQSDCCCVGTEITQSDAGQELFPQVLACRDNMLQHPRIISCDLLAKMPSSMPLDSRYIYAETLISNQPSWLNFYNNTFLRTLEFKRQETIRTMVLIPIPGGLIELLVTKQHAVDFVTAQCSISLEEAALTNITGTRTMSEINSKQFLDHLSFKTTLENLNLQPYDASMERTSNSPMNLLQQFTDYNLGNLTKNNIDISSRSMTSETQQHIDMQQYIVALDLMLDCSDQIDEEEDVKYQRRRTRKGPQSKNLIAERKKKEELQKQAKQLQDKLEDHAEDDGANNNIKSEIQSQSGVDLIRPKTDDHQDDHKVSNGFHFGTPGDCSISKQSQDYSYAVHDHKTEQMEPQVEVAQLDRNQFFVKVFCEQKLGGFVLIEALSSLSLEVTNANMTSFRCLVSNVFIVEPIRRSEMAKPAENCIGLDDHQHQQHLHNHHFSPFHLHYPPNEA